ncbi:MAG: hypothetical protein QNK37_29410 [Acidobacteriota bacterium]|nr:hypothetical protein [Acidobacteriota bacterium]
MERFYTDLKTGMHKDEAIRRAQIEFIEGTVPIKKHRWFSKKAPDISRPLPGSLPTSRPGGLRHYPGPQVATYLSAFESKGVTGYGRMSDEEASAWDG